MIFCNDGNPQFARAAVEAGFLYGARLPSTVYETVYFADQDWKNPNRTSYMNALAIHKPAMATVVDWEYPEQLPLVLSWADEAAHHCGKIVIIPKVHGGIASLPRSVSGKPVILGYSVPTSYGGTTLGLWEFQGWPVHLLGGSPQKQMELACYLDVVSVDGNMAHQQAHKGRFWDRVAGPKGHWRQLAETGDTGRDGANLRAFRLSCVNIMEAWRRHGRDGCGA